MQSHPRTSPQARAVADLAWRLMNAVRDIDMACQRPIRGVESGLCNVKSQFEADIAAGSVPAPPRGVKEEDAITWLLARALPETVRGGLWVKYPGTRNRTCDLVLGLPDGLSFWIEVKLAWKTWFNCNGTVGLSSSYVPYLHGSKHRTHSAADDFVKLRTLAPPSAYLGLLLVGFDNVTAPMAPEVEVLMKKADDAGWTADSMMWHDRRNPKCRVNCWFWHHPPAQEAGGTAGRAISESDALRRS